MKRLAIFLTVFSLMTLTPGITGSSELTALQSSERGGDTWVFADFEQVKDGRPVSNGGGFITIATYESMGANKSRFKGMENASPPAPELVRLKKDDPNRAAAFDYELAAPNQWAGVILQVHGQPDKDNKPVPDDVTAYKYLMVQIYVTGIQSMRVEFISRGLGINMEAGYPQLTFRVQPGFNTYKIELSKLAQPSWVQERYDPKEIFKKLTSIDLSAYCDQCTPIKGTVVVDNMVFHKK
jgi:hypothetical protein